MRSKEFIPMLVHAYLLKNKARAEYCIDNAKANIKAVLYLDYYKILSLNQT